MCGIAGIINPQGINPSLLKNISTALKHRGPDDEGYFLSDSDLNKYFLKGKDSVKNIDLLSIDELENNHFALGFIHRRLSIIDLTSQGHQPMNWKNRYVLIYNGEIYNYLEIKSDLEKKGYSFVSSSDTEVILAAYDEWRSNCTKKFIGMWAFAIYDIFQKQIFLSRDRFGIKPLYYNKSKSSFSFASEIKALLKIPWIERNINHEMFYNFIYWGRSSDLSQTLFSEINELPAGFNAYYDIENSLLKLEKYYDLNSAVINYNFINNNDLYNEYSLKLQDSVQLHLRSDVPIGTCLSGGLDSSSIVAFSAPLIKSTFNSFTASYPDDDIDEKNFAERVVSHYPNISSYFTEPNSKNFWNNFDRIIYEQDLPFKSSSIYAQWEVMKLVHSQGVKVILDGQGADESLGGYSFFSGLFLIELLKNFKIKKFLNERKLLSKNRTIQPFYEIKRSAYNYMPDLIKRKLRNSNRISNKFISKEYSNLKRSDSQNTNSVSFEQKSIDSMNSGLKELLRYEDRNSMAFSIESRVPFLDHRLVEFSIALETNYKIKDGWTKYILRKVIEKKLPSEIVWRKDKKGFVTPQSQWKKELKNELVEFLNDSNISPIFNKKKILEITKEELLSDSQLSEYWKLISTIKWLQEYKITI